VTPEDVHKKVDEFVAELTEWANDDSGAVLELIERLSGKPYVTKAERELFGKFLYNHINMLAVLTATLNSQRRLAKDLIDTKQYMERTQAANEKLIALMKKFLPPDIRDGMDKIK